jgi:hypothetical protein
MRRRQYDTKDAPVRCGAAAGHCGARPHPTYPDPSGLVAKCCSSSMVKNGENANLKRVPWVQIPDAQKIRGKKKIIKKIKKPPEKGTGYLIRI